MNKLHSLLVGLLIAGLAHASIGQTAQEITVRVINKATDKPLPKEQVDLYLLDSNKNEIRENDRSLVLTAETDDSGRAVFQLPNNQEIAIVNAFAMENDCESGPYQHIQNVDFPVAEVLKTGFTTQDRCWFHKAHKAKAAPGEIIVYAGDGHHPAGTNWLFAFWAEARTDAA